MRARVVIVTASLLMQFLLCVTAYAECPGPSAIFYVNGIANTKSQAEASAVQLSKAIQKALELGCQMPPVTLAYNATAGAIWDLDQALTQIRNGVDDNDPDLVTHLGQYLDAIDAGRKVVVVAHSQGNLYANQEYGKLALVPILPIDQHFAIVAVATPASFVAGDGPHVTLFEDLFASVAFLFARPPNTTNFPICGYSISCHSFVNAYLNGVRSGPKIVAAVIAALPRPSDGSVTLLPGQVARLRFRTNPPFTSAGNTGTPDLLQFIVGGESFLATGNPTATVTLFDGATQLGAVSSNVDCCTIWTDFKSATSTWPQGTIIPFSSILNGTIDGSVEVRINQGTLTFSFTEETVSFALFAPCSEFPASGCSPIESWTGMFSWRTITSMSIDPQ